MTDLQATCDLLVNENGHTFVAVVYGDRQKCVNDIRDDDSSLTQLNPEMLTANQKRTQAFFNILDPDRACVYCEVSIRELLYQ